MTNRDPKIDPKPGDILRKKFQGALFESRSYYEREVTHRTEKSVGYLGTNRGSHTSLRNWRSWAKSAEVVISSAVEPSTSVSTESQNEAKS